MKFQTLYQNVSLVFPVIKMCLTETLKYTIQHGKITVLDETLTYDEQDQPTSDSVNEESNQRRKRK